MLLEFIERVLADQRFAVVGESRGSYHARGIVFKRPESVDGMMLLSAGGMTKDAQSRLPEHETIVRDQIPPLEMTKDETARYERLVVRSPDILERIRRTKIPAAEISDVELEERLRLSFEYSFDLDDPGFRFDKPCLIIAGRQFLEQSD